MSLFKKLVSRGSAVIREWHNNECVNERERTMIAEIGAFTLLNLCGDSFNNWSQNERDERVNALRIALTTAYQIGKNASPCFVHRNKSPNTV